MTNHQRGTDLTRRRFLQATGAGSVAAWAWADHPLAAEDAGEASLPQRVLGKTGEKVPVLGLGTAPAGRRPRKEAAEFYEQAIAAGVTFLDTAPEFAGYGIAQKALGDVLKNNRKGTFVVTKCFEPSGEAALKLLKRNLEELQIEQADLVYAHSIGDNKMDLEIVLSKDGVLPALEKARRDGLCRFIGISGHNRPEKFLKVMEEFDIQVMMNAVNPVIRHVYNFEERVWPTARKNNIALVSMKILGGMYRSEGTKQPAGKGGRIRGARTEECFRYAMGLPDVSTNVLGCYDLEELNEAIGWVQHATPLSDEQLEDLLTWGRQQAKDWGPVHGAVEWEQAKT